MSIRWQCLKHAEADPALRHRINQLLDLVWPAEPAIPSGDQPAHDLSLAPVSILGWQGETRLVAYAAVLSKPIRIGEQHWLASGLSCVCVHPQQRLAGLGQQLLQQANLFLSGSQADLGLFTCDAPLQHFYQRAGWQPMPKLTVLGNRQPGAINSRDSGKCVMLRLLSPAAQAQLTGPWPDELDLDLPPGQFW